MSQKKPLVVYGGALSEISSGDQVHPSSLGSGTRDGTKFLRDDGVWTVFTSQSESGVSSFTFVDGNGFVGTVNNPTSVPTLSLTLTDITPTSVTTGAFSSTVSLSTSAVTITQNGSGKALDVTGNSTFTGDVSLSSFITWYSAQGTVNTTSTTVVDAFSAATFRSAKYQVQISDGTNFEVLDMHIMHDGTNVFLTSYGHVFNTPLSQGHFDAEISLGNVVVTFTANAATNKTIKFVRSAITI